MVQYTLAQENSAREGNALRNLLKLIRSGLVNPIIKYHQKCCECGDECSDKKPLELPIHQGNPADTYVLLTSIATQQQRKEIQEKNQLPKGFTRSPKIGAKNYAFLKGGCKPTEASTYFTRKDDGIIILPEGAGLITNFVEEHRDKINF
jgi:hypothetical protein